MVQTSKTSKKESLADRIAKVLSTAPASLDPEDELADETRAKLNTETVEDDDIEEELLSNFRKQNVDLLGDIDERYAGKKTSRKRLSNFEESDDEEESLSGDNSENENSAEKDEESDQDESETDDEEESNEESEQSGSESENDLSETESTANFEHMKSEDVPLQLKKGICVRNQLSIWESLLEMRIQVQKCLTAANRMPRKEKFKEIKAESGQEFSNKVSETAGSVSTLLSKLLELQSLVLNKYPETKKLMKNEGKVDEDPDNEEIPSDTDQELSEEDADEDVEKPPKKRRKISEFETEIEKQHSKYKDYRNSVIRKWHDKTTISIMKSNTNQYSVINNIEHTLNDKSKLVKRTQLKRADYKIIGEEDTQSSTEDSSNPTLPAEYNPEIFDDNDFYHQLLRELIEFKSSDITDPVMLGRKWIQLESLRSKFKRKIDTRATKGRKIRYVLHKNLLNYLAAMEENLWSEESTKDLFSSLFGKSSIAST